MAGPIRPIMSANTCWKIRDIRRANITGVRAAIHGTGMGAAATGGIGAGSFCTGEVEHAHHCDRDTPPRGEKLLTEFVAGDSFSAE
jgi:hypothetical protein